MNTQAQTFDIQGHRGSRGLRPENTLQAFEKALELGVTTLELDVCISKDHQVVVSHEPYFHSLFSITPEGVAVTKDTEKELNLYLMNYSQIKQFDTGLRGNERFPEQQKMAAHKPLLTEVLAFAEAYCQSHSRPKVHYNIEIKSEEKEYNISQPTVEVFSDLVYPIIIQYVDKERITLQSFDFNVLKFWKKQITTGQYQKVLLSALVETQGVSGMEDDLGFDPDIFSPYYKLLTPGKVEKCHAKGIRVIPWTVNDVEAMKRMKEIGCDGLITDYPDRAMFLLK